MAVTGKSLLAVATFRFFFQLPRVLAMRRLAALTALVFCLGSYSRVEAQEDTFGVHTPNQNLEADVVQIETQVKLSKYKNLLAEISKLELELASVVYVDQKDAEQSEPLLFQKEHRLEKLKAEATATREQLDKVGVPHTKDQLTKNEAESKLWHETMEKFNGLASEQKWREAEQLANEMASKFGSEDALIQAMLWTSINGQRKSQGLAPLIRERKSLDTKAPVITIYSIKDALPTVDKDVPIFVDVLTQSISAAIESSGTEKSESKIVYDAENQRLMVAGSTRQFAE